MSRILIVALVLLSVAAAAEPADTRMGVVTKLDPADHGVARLAVVHYHRPDGDYDGWNLWAWPEDGEGESFAFDGQIEAGADGRPGGVYAVVPIADDDAARLGFIVRKNEWEAKDVGRDRFVALPEEQGVAEVWLVSGDPRVYGAADAVDLEPQTLAAFLDGDDMITLAVTAPLSDEQLAGIQIHAEIPDDVETVGQLEKLRGYKVADVHRNHNGSGAGIVYTLITAPPVADTDLARLILDVPALGWRTVYARDVLTAERFTSLDAELGAGYTPEATTFRVWSPVSRSVAVMLEEPGPAGNRTREVPMDPVGRGVWEAVVEGDLHGTPYRYSYLSYGQPRIAPDIYARAATPDSAYSIVIDTDRTDPDGWADDAPLTVEHMTDEVIYEVHVRDFTARDETVPETLRGTYLGLIHENPGDPEAFAPATGLSHLKELGVSAVHLLPIQDYGSERGEYNWGYWTSLFNVPESSYGTDPDDPVAVARDLKTAIQGLHDAGLRVILDVVYNHTSSSGEHSPFDAAVPFYYFRTDDDGAYRNDAGVGNAVADERPMVRKYILDSLKYWTAEYHVDGFRFDLVGTHHPETVRAIAEQLEALRPDLTLYGEPWTGGGPIYFGKGAQRGLEFAVFNDHLRNAVRGDLDGTATGFATGPGGDSAALARGVAGGIDDFTTEPIEAVSYVSAHDNLTLWDKIAKSNPDATDAERVAMQKLALGIVLTSQGVAFLHGGSDFARTKGGEHNSYNLGDAVNAFDWKRKAEYREVFDYVAGLVAMRRAHPAFRMPDDALVREHLTFRRTDEVVAYTLDGAAVGDDWSEVFVAYNGQPTMQRVELPEGEWQIAVNAEFTGNDSLGSVRNVVEVQAYAMVVLFRE